MAGKPHSPQIFSKKFNDLVETQPASALKTVFEAVRQSVYITVNLKRSAGMLGLIIEKSFAEKISANKVPAYFISLSLNVTKTSNTF